MKRVFFLFLIAVAFAWSARAAVELTNLNRGDFIVDPTAAPTNVVILNLPHGGAPDLPGDIISLVGGTNFWEVVGGNLHPKVLNNIVQVTNLISYDVLTANNEFVIQASFSTNLVAGANQLPTWHVGFARLSSDAASTTPADRTVTLQGASGSAQGQLLFLENIWGVLGTQPSAFTLVNGSALWGPGTGIVVLQNGDWAPTQNGESLFLQYDGDNWREVARFFGPGGGTGNALINPTVNYLPKRGPATNLVDSLVHDDGTWVYVDGTGTATIDLNTADGQITWPGATNALFRTGQSLRYTNAATVTSVNIEVQNGAGRNTAMAVINGVGTLQTTEGQLVLAVPGKQLDMDSTAIYPNVAGGLDLGTTALPFRHLKLTNGIIYLNTNQLTSSGTDLTWNGAVLGGAGPWTESPIGTASLVAGVTNASVTATVSANNVVATNTVKAGYANAWKLGAVKTCSAVTVVLTNYIEIVIDGTTNAIPILNVTP